MMTFSEYFQVMTGKKRKLDIIEHWENVMVKCPDMDPNYQGGVTPSDEQFDTSEDERPPPNADPANYEDPDKYAKLVKDNKVTISPQEFLKRKAKIQNDRKRKRGNG